MRLCSLLHSVAECRRHWGGATEALSSGPHSLRCHAKALLDAFLHPHMRIARRSLKAVYYLQQAGFSKVTHVQGGLSAWIKEGLPTTDDNDDGGELVTSGGSLKLSLPFLGSR